MTNCILKKFLGKQSKERKYQSLQTERGTGVTGIDGMIENETEMREELKREARTDMIDTMQDHMTNPVTVHTGLIEILGKRTGKEEVKMAGIDLEMRLIHLYALVTVTTGNGSIFFFFFLHNISWFYQ